MAKKSNYPPAQLDNLQGTGTFAEIGSQLVTLSKASPPQSDEEVDQRIDEYIKFCIDNDFRVGVESACLCIGITRMTLLNWCNGKNCSRHRQDSALRLKQFIASCLESLNLAGKINPVSAIFYSKNWLGYKDSVSVDVNEADTNNRQTIEEIQARYTISLQDNSSNDHAVLEMPEAEF